jgi:two-component system KDP operon response regulator KdpE
MTPITGHRILLVEDNDLNRTLVRTVLARSDHPVARHHTIIEAGDLAAARAHLAAAPVDLILLDMQLPDGHGLDLARELSRQPPPARPVIIALTASVLPEQQNDVRAAGCDDFLGKPYRPHQLIDMLAAHLPAQDPAATP